MTRKDFELIADVLAEIKGWMRYADHALVARTFADRLAHTNPRFNRDRFLRACDVAPVDRAP